MPPTVTLLTSIPPRLNRPILEKQYGRAWQRACVESWRSAGFRVVSLNPAEEQKQLEWLNTLVEFRLLPPGQKRPSIQDFMTVARGAESEIVGIVNADCFLLPGFGGRLSTLPGRNALLLERININPKTLKPTGQTCFGFDAFFFKTADIPEAMEDAEHWEIGSTWWDYWLPLTLENSGLDLRTLPYPVLLHLDHDMAWRWEEWEQNFQRFRKLIPDWPPTSDKREDIIRLSHSIFYELRRRELLWTPERDSADEIMAAIIKAVSAPPPAQLSIPRRVIRRLRSELARVIRPKAPI